jgi:uncharacterized protein (DUF58 family)
LPDLFPQGFRAMLEQILRQNRRIQGGQTEVARARHRALAQSGTFAGHRAYAPGDDLRRLDWNAFARTGHLFVKLLEDDDRRATSILVDVSPSMLCGEPPRLVTALRLAAILGGLSLVHLDGVQVHAGDQQFTLQGRGTTGDLLQRLTSVRSRREAAAETVHALLRASGPRKLHWISDFAEPARIEPLLQLLRRQGRQVTGWLPSLPTDLLAPNPGWTRVVDPESGAEHLVAVDAAMSAALVRELHLLERQQVHAFVQAGFPFQRVHLPTQSFEAGDWLEAGWSFRR